MLTELLSRTGTARFEDFGEMNIASASWSDDRLDVILSIQQDDTRDETREYWRISCTSVVEYRIERARHCGLNYWTDDHPALAQYTEPFEALYTGKAANDPDAFLGRLWAAHRNACDDWIPFERYINSSFGIESLGRWDFGLIAEGPSFLVEAYAALLSREGMRPKRVASRLARTHAPDAKLIHFGDSYVIANEFDATKMSEPSIPVVE